MLTNYTANEVHTLANRLEAMARALRIIQGRMLGGKDLPQIGWNDQTFLTRLAEVETYFEGMVSKYEAESLKAQRKREKTEAAKLRADQVAHGLHAKKSGKKSSA